MSIIAKKRSEKYKRKGQAALEFLTTYGWAMMAIILAVGALYYFDIINPNKFIQTKCETGSQIECVEAVLYDDGSFDIRLRNNNPVDLAVKVDAVPDNKPHITLPEKIIPKNSIGEFSGGAGVTFTKNQKVDLALTVSFKRSTSGTYYTTKGAATLKVVPK